MYGITVAAQHGKVFIEEKSLSVEEAAGLLEEVVNAIQRAGDLSDPGAVQLGIVVGKAVKDFKDSLKRGT